MQKCNRAACLCLTCFAPGYLLTAPPYVQVWHKAFLWWVRTKGRSPHVPGISQKCLGRLRRRAMNPTSPKGVKAWGEGPLRPKEPPKHRDTLGQIRAPTARPAKVLPSTWRGPVRNQFVSKMIWTGSRLYRTDSLRLFLVINTRRHEALWFWGRGRERSCFNYIFYGEPS